MALIFKTYVLWKVCILKLFSIPNTNSMVIKHFEMHVHIPSLVLFYFFRFEIYTPGKPRQ
jgi:hypothetical protein